MTIVISVDALLLTAIFRAHVTFKIINNNKEIKMKHRHAELMMQYARDALETNKPWERWEFYDSFHEWVEMSKDSAFLESREYRRKPKTININGFKVPEPIKEPLEIGDKYYIPGIIWEDEYKMFTWGDDRYDHKYLAVGFIHLDRESATLHYKALLSFTKQVEK